MCVNFMVMKLLHIRLNELAGNQKVINQSNLHQGRKDIEGLDQGSAYLKNVNPPASHG